MADKEFAVELYGASGSGKSTFLEFIKKACNESKKWTAVDREFGHSLLVTQLEIPAIPSLKADNQVEL